MTVASRRAPNNAHIEVRCLDLGHIEDTNRWEVLVLEGSDRPDSVIEPLLDHTGTVVLWENLDRILEYKDPWGDWAKKKLMALAEQVDNHLGMVFPWLSGRRGAGPTLDDRCQRSQGPAMGPFLPEGKRKRRSCRSRGSPSTGDSGTEIVRMPAVRLAAAE